MKVVPAASYAVYTLQFNTKFAPLSSLMKREALYYATDASALNKAIFKGLNGLTQSPTAPGALYFEGNVPGYRTYNLKKAQPLVKEAGGVSVTLGAGAGAETTLAEAIESEWRAAGIQVQLSLLALPQIISEYQSGNWQVLLEASIGAYDPALALPLRYTSTGALTGVNDPTLDQLIEPAAGADRASAKDSLSEGV